MGQLEIDFTPSGPKCKRILGQQKSIYFVKDQTHWLLLTSLSLI